MTVAGSGRVPMRKSRGGLEDFVGSAQLSVLSAQPAQFLGLDGGGLVQALTVIGLVLTDPAAKRLGMHAELLGQALDHRLGVGLPVEPHSALAQLVRVLAWGGHENLLVRVYQTMIESLRANGGTSQDLPEEPTDRRPVSLGQLLIRPVPGGRMLVGESKIGSVSLVRL
ncbi:hypothetical protein Cci01nite_16610 [Catellatospora citrea]|uniref:Uncharacterized protein n=1 Tax=Catellatospora citrea TaxID=53366 RepID=A0A8J3NXQ2_9ACTN|nr:hypothetical protein [Catellatospora citrea]GIF96567.1 hypothetical protein Cci01nite_16610 [Catellatospora citrea]